MINNAIAYITRKKNRTFIVFIILTMVLSCLYSCLSVIKSSDGLEKSLYKSSNSSLSITKKDNSYFNIKEFKDIKKFKEIEEIIYYYTGLARPKKTKVVEGKQRIEMDNLSNNLKNIVSIESTSSTNKNTLFTSGVFVLKEGKHINKNDRNKILIHEEYAKKNGLKLKDKIHLELFQTDNSSSGKQSEFEIVGIFSGKKQETYTGLSSDFSENMMFTDYESTQKALGKENNNISNKIVMYSNSPESAKETLTKLKELNFDWSKYDLEKDSKAFDETLESLGGIKKIIQMMTYLIMLGGIIVLSLILILWLRERIYEIGILLSIGIKKINIILQFIIELIFISIPSILFSVFIGNFLVKQIMSGFLSSNNIEAFTNNLFNNEKVSENIIIFAQSYGILISIIIISVIIASAMILVKKPKEILSKIS
ncbi:ABC transporter permease [Helcococcus kunzii]|uniref:ABC transporter permease n=1 Tax=Helcococcus kunzii TaxID=40091 RepID=UPI001C9664F3|nr:FtsX-like permease family protein [Helcococcus kunzii]MCT1796557.1 FtsX-like permease family protein [Helcococcus kunzii]MCT1989903.1 FtsX-like permease family protein [Helcococcus kunzii]QZO76473.1 FtsX-like permease family protein [Helcococcus kunzii]